MGTDYAWTRRLAGVGCGSPTPSGGPRDNPEMESCFGRFKVENRSLIPDVESLKELRTMVRKRTR